MYVLYFNYNLKVYLDAIYYTNRNHRFIFGKKTIIIWRLYIRLCRFNIIHGVDVHQFIHYWTKYEMIL